MGARETEQISVPLHGGDHERDVRIELDPELRRDGVGFAVLGVSIVVAASVWWQIPGAVGQGVRWASTGSVGLLAWVAATHALLSGCGNDERERLLWRNADRLWRLGLAWGRM